MEGGDRPIYQRLADVFAQGIDEPNAETYINRMYGDTPLKKRFYDVLGKQRRHLIPDDFGVLQNPPQYWGSRMTLPMSGDDYARPPVAPADEGLRQEVYGELIRRGYPVLGGSQMFGRPKGFKPIGFGQR